MKNHKLARKALDRISANPKQFDMGTWGDIGECGTVACLAGHVLLAAGYEHRSLDGGGSVYVSPLGENVHLVASEAMSLLGMETDEVLPRGEAFPIWFDVEHGLARFRHLTENAEKESL